MVQERRLATKEVDMVLASPEQIVENATAQAKLLMNIVEQTKCFQEISGKKYLQVEAWETIGAFNQTHAETESIAPILRDNEIIGYQAHVQLWKNGIVAGGAIMPCYFTENCCKGKEDDAKHKACMSAAQTFATSKAYRMNFSYVAILAGFQPMPAEEITTDMKSKVDQTQHYCEEHDTNFFKKGKMKSYSHPIGDTGEWCREHKEKPKAEEPKTEEAEPPSSSSENGETSKRKGEKLTDPETITNIEKLAEALKKDFGMSYQQQWNDLGINSWNELTYSPKEAYKEIASRR